MMEDKSFTESLELLRKAASDISNQATTLEDALKLYENGMKEAEFCRGILDKAQQTIKVYTEENADA